MKIQQHNHHMRAFIGALSFLVMLSAAEVWAGQASRQIPGQNNYSLQAARNFAAVNRADKLPVESRFIPLQARRPVAPLRRVVSAGKPPAPASDIEQPTASKETRVAVDMTQSQAKQILSIFASSD
jgi:hypothetical protein